MRLSSKARRFDDDLLVGGEPRGRVKAVQVDNLEEVVMVDLELGQFENKTGDGHVFLGGDWNWRGCPEDGAVVADAFLEELPRIIDANRSRSKEINVPRSLRNENAVDSAQSLSIREEVRRGI